MSRPTLRIGSKGPVVAELQMMLNARGCTPRLTADGAFGPKTDAGVKWFQSLKRLTVDGVVGPMTWNALEGGPTGSSGSSPNTSAGSPSGSATVPAPGTNRPPPAGHRAARRPTPAVVAKANEVLRSGHPIGTHLPMMVDGKPYVFALEWHKHPPTDPVPDSLKKWHRGVTVYEPG